MYPPWYRAPTSLTATAFILPWLLIDHMIFIYF
jgi:hypothetical protein